ncbi:MAG: dTDP-glucose 4,6-dehydratase [Pseudomonadota bacterium]|nr:dTDP-glucose 4,6-dehydratase [Pseudomonadota bacterium]
MTALLVTGGAGFIGSNFVRHWQARFPGQRILVLDRLTYAANPATLEQLQALPDVTAEVGDIADQERVSALLRRHRIDTIVNFAAESHVDRSIAGPATVVVTNVLGTQALLEAARRVWLQQSPRRSCRFHQISTDEVYGELAVGQPPFRESDPYHPSSPYAASKAAADHLVYAYGRTYGLPVSVSHSGNNYGPFQHPEKLIPLTITRVLQGATVPVYGDGLQRRCWLPVATHCLGIEAVLRRGRAGGSYHLGGGLELSNLELLQQLCGLLDQRFQAQPQLAAEYPLSPMARGEPAASLLRHVTDRPGHDRRYGLDTGRAVRELGFAPEAGSLAELGVVVDWYLRQRPWWRYFLPDEAPCSQRRQPQA